MFKGDVNSASEENRKEASTLTIPKIQMLLASKEGATENIGECVHY